MKTKTAARCCPTCGQEISTNVHINWPDAFNKFGYGDGDGEIYTYEIAEHIQELDLECGFTQFCMHNDVIDSIKSYNEGGECTGVELIPNGTVIGYDNPRKYLPAFIVEHLDKKYNGESYL